MDDAAFPLLCDGAAAEICEQSHAPRRFTSTRPSIVRQWLEESDDCLDAGVVHEDVETAELFPGLVHHRFGISAFGDVAFDGDRLAALCLNGFGDLFSRLRTLDVVHRDVGALIGKYFGDSASDAAAGSGDECFFTF